VVVMGLCLLLLRVGLGLGQSVHGLGGAGADGAKQGAVEAGRG
jgi:hypothetical protein